VPLSRTVSALLALPVAIALGASMMAAFAVGVSALLVASRFGREGNRRRADGRTITLERGAYRMVTSDGPDGSADERTTGRLESSARSLRS